MLYLRLVTKLRLECNLFKWGEIWTTGFHKRRRRRRWAMKQKTHQNLKSHQNSIPIKTPKPRTLPSLRLREEEDEGGEELRKT